MNFQNTIFFLVLLYNVQTAIETPCTLREQKIRKILRGNSKNMLSFRSGGLLTTARTNYYQPDFYSSIPTRDTIYIVNFSFGFTYSALDQSLIFRTMQSYEINTVFLSLWDYTYRTYNFQVFISFNGTEKLIFDSLAATGSMYIKFADQQVDTIRYYNRGGSTDNFALILIKVEAFYKR
ncbi:unnamed protein product [Paramecium octaurelia]|uniref:Uncharacterized protein n=1 Tax=Paramecium octaurelia TaxID=43137 RepID=A0A8S1SAK9_PAROT|nr:unnamed protein product [Paramecium octaurelia]